MIIAGKIDVTQVDKAKLFKGKVAKDGHTPQYLDITILMRDEPDQYGNSGMIVQSATKEERVANKRGKILGNIKILGTQSMPHGAHSNNDTPPDDSDSKCPF